MGGNKAFVFVALCLASAYCPAKTVEERARDSEIKMKDLMPVSSAQRQEIEDYLVNLDFLSLEIGRWHCVTRGTRAFASTKSDFVKVEQVLQEWALDSEEDFERWTTNARVVFGNNGGHSVQGWDVKTTSLNAYLKRDGKFFGFAGGARLAGELATVARKEALRDGLVFPVRLAESCAVDAQHGLCRELDRSCLKIDNLVAMIENSGFDICLFDSSSDPSFHYFRMVWFYEGRPIRVDDSYAYVSKADAAGSGDKEASVAEEQKIRESAVPKARTETVWKKADKKGQVWLPASVHAVNFQGPREIEYELEFDWKLGEEVDERIFSKESIPGTGVFMEKPGLQRE